MTSMNAAPSPISIAHANPRRAPSLMMVRLMGPTGTDEKTSALKNPAIPAKRIECDSIGSVSDAMFIIIFFNLPAPGTRNVGPDKTVKQVGCEEKRQHVINDFILQNQEAPEEYRSNHDFQKRGRRAQSQRLE